jgi:putative DNA primase/helicase
MSRGPGRWQRAILAALADYADAADPELLTARTFDAHPTGIADLFGLRLAILHESDHGRRLAEGTVKRLTGGDRVKARRMREDFWHFEPSHTFLMLTNHKPVISGTDEGIWRRIHLIPWDVDIAVGDKLALELDAVLAWLVQDHAGWRAKGLAPPAKVTEATDTYKSESDALGRFLEQRCLLYPACGPRNCSPPGKNGAPPRAKTTARKLPSRSPSRSWATTRSRTKAELNGAASTSPPVVRRGRSRVVLFAVQ